MRHEARWAWAKGQGTMFSVSQLKPDPAPYLKNMAERDIKFANRVAVTRLSKFVQAALTREIERSVDRPSAFTRRAVLRRPVRDDGRAVINGQPVAKGTYFSYEVFLRDEAFKGTPPSRYLAPLIYGGSRQQKRFEKAFQARNVMPGGTYAVPGMGAKLDRHGNIASGQIRQLLSYFNAAEQTAGFNANMSARRRKSLAKGSKRTGRRGVEYFVSHGPGRSRGGGRGNRRRQHLPAGIYARYGFGPLGSAIKPVMIFSSRSPRYRAQIKFFEAAEREIKQSWPGEYSRALVEAMDKAGLRRGRG